MIGENLTSGNHKYR